MLVTDPGPNITRYSHNSKSESANMSVTIPAVLDVICVAVLSLFRILFLLPLDAKIIRGERTLPKEGSIHHLLTNEKPFT